MSNLRIETPEERALWKAVAVAVSGASDCKRPSTPGEWADRIVEEFRKRLLDREAAETHPYRTNDGWIRGTSHHVPHEPWATP